MFYSCGKFVAFNIIIFLVCTHLYFQASKLYLRDNFSIDI